MLQRKLFLVFLLLWRKKLFLFTPSSESGQFMEESKEQNCHVFIFSLTHKGICYEPTRGNVIQKRQNLYHIRIVNVASNCKITIYLLMLNTCQSIFEYDYKTIWTDFKGRFRPTRTDKGLQL